MPREKLPSGVAVFCNKKGWMNTEVMGVWIEKCLRTRPGSFFKKKSLLVFDAMTAHKEPSVQKQINAVGAHIAVIPGGLTCKLQPLDVSVNHPFKTFVREEWDKWMTSGEHTYTPAGRQRRATYVEVCNWVIAAWKKVKVSTILNGFKKCCIMPPAEEAATGLSSDDETSDGEETDAETTGRPNPLDEEDRLRRVMDMFGDSDDDESFDGFASDESEDEDN